MELVACFLNIVFGVCPHFPDPGSNWKFLYERFISIVFKRVGTRRGWPLTPPVRSKAKNQPLHAHGGNRSASLALNRMKVSKWPTVCPISGPAIKTEDRN
jgi:hypothetical protein